MTVSGDTFHSGELIEGRYRVDGVIAEGGMSTVYRGLDTRLDRPVAIKVMDTRLAANPKLLQRFTLEAKTVAALSDPGIVAVYDQGIHYRDAFLVMELVQGGTLRELLRERGPMPPYAVVATIAPVLKALSKAHSHKLVHRDIKPENILISETGSVKVADFGLVHSSASNLVTSTVLVGTTAYLSPEQVTGGQVDAQSDIYSVGILTYELLTGMVPFGSEMTLAVANRRLNEDVPPPSDMAEELPTEFDDLVAIATHRDPSRRFSDAGIMLRAVEAISDTLDLPEYTVPAPRESAEQLSATALIKRPPQPRTDGLPIHQDSETSKLPERVNTAMYSTYLQGKPPASTFSTSKYDPEDRSAGSSQPKTPQPRRDSPSSAHAPLRLRRQAGRRMILIWLGILFLVTILLGIAGWQIGSTWTDPLAAVPHSYTEPDMRTSPTITTVGFASANPTLR